MKLTKKYKTDVEKAMRCAKSGEAYHWPTIAAILADEIERLKEIVNKGTQKPILERIWIDKEQNELRLDWSNERHHAIDLGAAPHDKENIASALNYASYLVKGDTKL